MAPFALFLALLALGREVDLGAWTEPLRLLLLTASLWFFSSRVIDLKVSNVSGSAILGAAVFLIWIAPDLLFEGYRHHWLFENALLGHAESSMPESLRTDTLFLVLRGVRAAIFVPIIEELFWRAWLMRWIADSDFKRIPLGTYVPRAFWITVVLFASEHGSHWDVGLAAGILYNWWMLRTKRLGDCILAHAVTNAALSAYVIFAGKWQYWT